VGLTASETNHTDAMIWLAGPVLPASSTSLVDINSPDPAADALDCVSQVAPELIDKKESYKLDSLTLACEHMG
jgi:hypothetical protein